MPTLSRSRLLFVLVLALPLGCTGEQAGPGALEQAPPGAAFAASWQAFVLNTLPLLAYAAASLVLLAFGLATMGLGLVLALPLWVASTYAAWKDIFGIRDAPVA